MKNILTRLTSKRKPRVVILQVRATEPFVKMLDYFCAKTDMNRSEFIRGVCRLAFMEDKGVRKQLKEEEEYAQK
jgi:23S rRNA C2498 (ribose-2'-O)-methylase RlmM